MELDEVLRRRHIVRSYADRAVSTELLHHVLAAALRAPSAGHTRGTALLLCDEPDSRGRFWAAATPSGQGSDRWSVGLRRAPVVVVVLFSEAAYRARYAEPDKVATARGPDTWSVPYWHVDAGMAALLVLLRAVDEGLGACFFGVPAQQVAALREAFGVPAEYAPVGAVTLGYPARPIHSAPSRSRARMADVVHRGHWGMAVPVGTLGWGDERRR